MNHGKLCLKSCRHTHSLKAWRPLLPFFSSAKRIPKDVHHKITKLQTSARAPKESKTQLRQHIDSYTGSRNYISSSARTTLKSSCSSSRGRGYTDRRSSGRPGWTCQDWIVSERTLLVSLDSIRGAYPTHWPICELQCSMERSLCPTLILCRN